MISEPKTAIVGNDELYIEAGSTINLTCTIQTGPTAETLIYWNYNGKVRIISFGKLYYNVHYPSRKAKLVKFVKTAAHINSSDVVSNPILLQ